MKKVENISDAPFNKICHLVIHRKRFPKKNKSFNSTGFFISKNFILTAAHNIHSQSFTKVDSIEINIGQNNESRLFQPIHLNGLVNCSKHSFTPDNYSLTQRWQTRRLNDYGLIYVPNSMLPDGFEWNNEFKLNQTLLNDCVAEMAGYPADIDAGYNAKEMFYQRGSIKIQSAKVYEHSFKTQGGNSGSPVWNMENNVVGIHTFSRSGTLIDSDAMNNIKNWMDQITY